MAAWHNAVPPQSRTSWCISLLHCPKAQTGTPNPAQTLPKALQLKLPFQTPPQLNPACITHLQNPTVLCMSCTSICHLEHLFPTSTFPFHPRVYKKYRESSATCLSLTTVNSV